MGPENHNHAKRLSLRALALEGRRAAAFILRDYHLTKRYFSWVIVFLFYTIVNSAIVVLIGVAAGDEMQTLNLLLGVLLWSYLSALFHEIAHSISYERWEGTIEYTFMAPVSRATHLFGVSVFAATYALIRVVLVLLALTAVIDVDLGGANLAGAGVVFILASFSFMGLGLLVAIFPLVSPEKGPQATHIVQALILLVSGVYYPIEVLPGWLIPFGYLSPATYALEANRTLVGINVPGSTPGALQGGSLIEVWPELLALAGAGAILIPLGLFVFQRAEIWAKKTGRLKRSG